MRIALDARFLTHPQRGGFKTYTENLVRALGTVDRDNDYIVYVDRSHPDRTSLPNCENMKYVVVDGTLPAVGMPFREQIALRRQISRDKPDLVHFLCNTATIGLRCPHVLTLHDTIQVSSGGPIPLRHGYRATHRWAQTAYSRKVINRVVRTASHLITVSQHERLEINRLLAVPLNTISVTYGAPDPVYDQPRACDHDAAVLERLRVRPPYLMGLGYETRKNIPILIEAFAELSRQFPALNVVIVSANSEQAAAFKTLATRFDLTSRTHVLGPTPSADLRPLYSGAAAFVFPSDREAFGLPVIEAMASGTPTVAMHASCLPEIVGDAGILINGRDPRDWASGIRRLLEDDNLRIELHRRGLARAKEFSWLRCAAETVAVYRQAGAADDTARDIGRD
jgi:glycosyltransferase involved in cell wall biosynthesis